MKKIVLISNFILLALFVGNAQTISGYSISSAGGFFDNQGGFQFNLGHIVLADNPYFHEIFNEIIVVNDTISYKNNDNDNILINTFPNPVVNNLNISITTKDDISFIDILVFDANGKPQKINYNHIFNDNYLIVQCDVSSLKVGTYIGVVEINRQFTKNFVFIK